METEQFVKEINNLRLQAKGWYMWTGYVNDQTVELKGHGTWLQIFRINGIHHHSPMEMKVRDFKQALRDAVTQTIKP